MALTIDVTGLLIGLSIGQFLGLLSHYVSGGTGVSRELIDIAVLVLLVSALVIRVNTEQEPEAKREKSE